MTIYAEDFQQEWDLRNRVQIGQVVDVDTRRGTITVLVEGLRSRAERVPIPLVGFSINGHRSSWIRYMPQVRDHVLVAYGHKNEPRIIGMTGQSGVYEEVADFKTKEPRRFPTGDFVSLAQGEWDLRSSGGAYVYGNKDGALLLSAGPTVLTRLDKKNNEARSEAGLWEIGGAGSFVRIGD